MRKFKQNRESNGRYDFDGNLDRMCVCGHTLGVHSCGSPKDCLMYSLPEQERVGLPGAENPRCGCLKFRLSRKQRKAFLAELVREIEAGGSLEFIWKTGVTTLTTSTGEKVLVDGRTYSAFINTAAHQDKVVKRETGDTEDKSLIIVWSKQ